jgi:hypothetical protein
MAGQDAAFGGKQQSILLRSFFVLNRSVVSTLVTLLILLAAFITWYPMRIPRNVVVYWAGFTGLLLSQAFLLVIRNLGRSQWTRWLSVANTTLELGCLVMWLWQFRSAAEERPVEIGHSWDSAQAEALIQQLQRINSSLERTTR